MKKFDLAKEFYKKASEVDPNDPEPYYSVAVIDWTQTYVPRQEERAKLGMKPEDSLPAKDKKVCALMKEKNTANVQEGIDNLNKALQLRPDYDDAMAYMNLMYRERADISATIRQARRRFEDGRRVGRQDHGHQESQGGKAARRGRHCDGSEQVILFAAKRRGTGFFPVPVETRQDRTPAADPSNRALRAPRPAFPAVAQVPRQMKTPLGVPPPGGPSTPPFH
jgi:tetratricopeptide (TPR) repeat protein